MKVLVSGGAGYIGSHMVKLLSEMGYQPTVFDNLSTGHRQAVKWGELVHGDLLDQTKLKSLFQSCNFDAVMHFSAMSIVGESVIKPDIYYKNNVIGTFNLLEAMRETGVAKLVFSSTAAIFGNPVMPLIDESHPMNPINPYGKTKLTVENMLNDYAKAYNLNSVSLRYFNAAGADPDGLIGESHNPETHLIPNMLMSVSDGKAPLNVFGSDYNTPDGTCIRDYIHINDLCLAHLKAIEFMNANKGAHFFNLGNGRGFSILEVIKAAENVIGKKICYKYTARRAGDPASLVADSTLAGKKLGWTPRYTEIEKIIETAWKWFQNKRY